MVTFVHDVILARKSVRSYQEKEILEAVILQISGKKLRKLGCPIYVDNNYELPFGYR